MLEVNPITNYLKFYAFLLIVSIVKTKFTNSQKLKNCVVCIEKVLHNVLISISLHDKMLLWRRRWNTHKYILYFYAFFLRPIILSYSILAFHCSLLVENIRKSFSFFHVLLLRAKFTFYVLIRATNDHSSWKENGLQFRLSFTCTLHFILTTHLSLFPFGWGVANLSSRHVITDVF